MLRYVKYSLAIHLAFFLVLIVSAWLTPKPKVEKLRFVVLPKGTGMDHVLTKEVVSKLTKPPGETPERNVKSEERKMETPQVQASPSPSVSPIAVASPTPALRATPNPTPAVANRATPAPTPQQTATPEPTVVVKKPQPTATPKPQPTTSATAKPATKASPSPRPGGKPVPKEKQASKTIATPKKTPTPTPKQLASAYDLSKGEAARRDPRLPSQTPAGATAADELPAGKQAGVPGVAEGIEGAPLVLNANQSALPQLYTNRAILLLQRNFIVPDGVNDPDLTCIVEWEILSDGTVKNAKVVKSTGNAEHDQRAIDAVEKTANLGPLPPQFQGKSVWVSLPFIYGQ